MIVPEPFFEPRGTPFSEYHRIRALLDLGHTVDLVTYPFGSQHCRGDIVRTMDRLSHIPGPGCVLGDFVPYRRP